MHYKKPRHLAGLFHECTDNVLYLVLRTLIYLCFGCFCRTSALVRKTRTGNTHYY